MKNVFAGSFAKASSATPSRRATAPAALALAIALSACGGVALAQSAPITSGTNDGTGGNSSVSGGALGQTPDARSSAMGAQAQPSTRTVVEGSEKPTAEHPANNRRNKAASHKSTKKSEGSSGFEKGMYGTGTGSTGSK